MKRSCASQALSALYLNRRCRSKRAWTHGRDTAAGPDGLALAPGARRQCDSDTVAGAMPKIWLYTQVAIVVFVCIGIVIAITKLA
jgi:hypothetical protein